MKNKFIIIYASQTGQAKAIAESIYDLASEKKYTCDIYCVSKSDKEFKLNELVDPVVFISSTTGDGEPPETALKLWNKLKRLNADTNANYLSNLNYALLGLGDSNYTQFANGPKLFYKKFNELGAKCFFGPFYADDATDLELVVEPFKEKLWSALNEYFTSNQLKQIQDLNIEYTLPLLTDKHLTIEYANSQTTNNLNLNEFFSKLFSINELYEARIIENKILTSPDAVKTCHGLKFEIKENKLTYEPGHAINIIVPNDKKEVHDLLRRLNCEDSSRQKITLKSTSNKKLGLNLVEMTQQFDLNLEILFTYCLDIRSPSIKKALVRMLSEYCSNREDKLKLSELCSKEGSNSFQSELKDAHLSLLDILNRFKSCQPPIDYLIQLLQTLPPRAYSFCSTASEMEIIFNLIEFDSTSGRTYERNGIATSYLSKLAPNDNIYLFKRKLQNFLFPTDDELTDKPLILIGPGTGVAPFISFLRSKLDQVKLLKNTLLFYGCRDPLKDLLYKDVLLNAAPHLNKLSLSFSRVDQIIDPLLTPYYVKNSKYIHDSLRFYSNEIAKLIYEQNGFVYVCGDALNMSKDIFSCLSECLVKTYSLNSGDADKYLLEMMKNRRYKQDVWA